MERRNPEHDTNESGATLRYEPGAHVERRGNAPAVIMADSAEVVTYRELDDRSKQVARLLRSAGLEPGDHVAIMMDNHPRYLEVFWGAQRAGLSTTPINWHLNADEVGYIVEDCGARAIFTTSSLADAARQLHDRFSDVDVRLMIDGAIDGWTSYSEAIAAHPAVPLDDEVEGSFMFYSSGTTGRPKGIKPVVGSQPFGSGGGALIDLMRTVYEFSADSVYLCPAPLYHAAPLGWTTAAQRLGATVVVMERFDPARCLELIEEHRVTHAQFVPTHFIRMLKLSAEERAAHSHASLRVVIHAAAPCPVEVKRRMIEWWGPIVHEYYSGSEGNGFCAIDSQDALRHPGSVGVPLIGSVHICDDHDNELPIGETGQIWFESDRRFEYHNDPDKTAGAYNDKGWSTLGDIGHLDAEGFLYLTDRASHMIISGGVNIYPQEVENELSLHPKVDDVAVIGVRNEDLGEEVKAVVVAADPYEAGDHLASELIDFCRSKLAHYKCPTTVDFVPALPRLPSGKLLKRQLRDQYDDRSRQRE